MATALDIALGRRPFGDCPSFGGDTDMRVTIDELVRAVSNALNGR